MAGVKTYTQPDYSAQSGNTLKGNIQDGMQVSHELAGQYAPHEQSVPAMTVRVDAGRLFDQSGLALTESGAQSTTTITAPAANPRNDIIALIPSTGGLAIIVGAEAASPSDPAIPADRLPICRVRLTVGMTEITNDDIDDLRALMFVPIKAGTGLAIASGQLDLDVGGLTAETAVPDQTDNVITHDPDSAGGMFKTPFYIFRGFQVPTEDTGDVVLTAADSGKTIRVDGGSAGASVTLPSDPFIGWSVTVVKTSTDVETAITVAPADSADLIYKDGNNWGASSISLSSQGQAVTFYYSGANTYYALAFSAGSSGSRTLLERQNITTASATVDMTSGDWSQYDAIEFEVTNLRPASRVAFHMRLSIGGSFVTGGSYDMASLAMVSVGPTTGFDYQQSSGTAWILTGGGADSRVATPAADAANSWRVVLSNPASTTAYTGMRFHGIFTETGGDAQFVVGGGQMVSATSAVDGARFYMSSGNITSVVISAWGVNQS